MCDSYILVHIYIAPRHWGINENVKHFYMLAEQHKKETCGWPDCRATLLNSDSETEEFARA
jgi:hypothetical protein